MTLLILRHVTTRVLIAIPLLLAVTLGTFLMLYSIGDPAAALAGEGATNAQIQEIRVAYGLDKPVLQQYATWLGNTLSGDLGSSMANKGSVSELVGDYLPPTLMLSAYAMLIATVTAVIMGSVVGSRPGGITDKIMQGISLLGVAIPNFLLALLLILIFAIQFQFLPPGGYRTPESVGLAETLKYLTLPALSLALSLMCLQTRTFRASLIEQYNELAPAAVPDHHVNGALTIGENIGDLGGLGIALKAYELSLDGAEAPVIDGLTGVQRLLLSWAQVWQQKSRDAETIRLLTIDPHSPNEFRCNQIVRNIDAFYEAFDVKPGDALWLDENKRVTIW